MEPSAQAAQLALEALEMVADRTGTEDRIDRAKTKLLTLRLLLRRILYEALPGQINLAAKIGADPAGPGADELLEGAFRSLVDEAGLLFRVGVAIPLYGSAHPSLRDTPRWEVWLRDHDATIAHMDEAILRLGLARRRANVSTSAITLAIQSYPRLSDDAWTAVMLTAEKVMRDATADARAALEEARLMRLAVAMEFLSLWRLLAVGGD